MHQTVRKAWPGFIAAYEGRTTWLYFDTHRPPLATTGVGHMVDAGGSMTSAGLALPWRTPSGEYVREFAAAAEYSRLRSLDIKGTGFAYREHAQLFLDASVVDWLLDSRTAEFWAQLTAQLPPLPTWPADAQLAVLNMGWHLGPRFLGDDWPKFTAAARIGHFEGMARECSTAANTDRDHRNMKLLLNAARVHYSGLPTERLWDAETPRQADARPAPLILSARAVGSAKGAADAVADLQCVQRMLQLAGFYDGDLDGIRGLRTNQALRAWARSRKLTYASSVHVLSALSSQTTRMAVTELGG